MKNGSKTPPKKTLRCDQCGAIAARNGNPFTAFTLRVHQARMHGTKKMAGETRLFSLTQRQQEIMEKIVAGQAERDVATKLGLSPHTVHHHVRTIYAKLGLKNRAEAVKKWLEAKPPAHPPAALRYCPQCGCHLASAGAPPPSLAMNAMVTSPIIAVASWSPSAGRNQSNGMA